MTVNTKKVAGRREIRYESLDELFADAERLSQTNVSTLGNWSQGQIYEHLARSLDSSIDGAGFSLPLPMRWMLTLLMKKKFLTKKLPAGFQAPEKLTPRETAVDEALASLKAAIKRQQQESTRAPHPAFGDIGRDGWNDFNLRHAELHMSFLVNGERGNSGAVDG